MKTIIDAVNYFKGEYPYLHPVIIYGNKGQGYSDYWAEDTKPNGNWYYVCSKEEFKNAIENMSLNFGKCSTLNLSDYQIVHKQELTKMKTTIDAVNELRADISNVAYIKSDETYHCNLNYNDDSGWWCSRGFYGDFVCTIDNFQTRVECMSFDYARFDVGSIEDYLVADKELLQPVKPKMDTIKINWDLAPEGATHYAKETSYECPCWIKRDSKDELSYITEGYHKIKAKGECDNWIPTEDFDMKDLTLMPQPSPVYTQKMADNGALPSVGMGCAFETTFFTHLPSNTGTGKPIAYHDNKVWFSTGSEEFVINLNVIYFKPLTVGDK
jgi:hypothetical protein